MQTRNSNREGGFVENKEPVILTTARPSAMPSPSFNIVSIYPGEMEFTLIPYLAHSAAKQFFKVNNADLLTL